MEPDLYSLIWTILFIIIMIPIVIGNGLIILSIMKFRRLRSPMHILIGNLAVADFVVGAVLIPYSLLADSGLIHEHKYLCFAKLSLFVVCLGTSLFNLMLISIERFVSIKYPLKSKLYFTAGKLAFMITFGWALSVINSTIPFYAWNTYSENNTDCVSDTLWSPEYKLMMNWEVIIALIINFFMFAVVVRVAITKASARLNRKIAVNLTVHARTDKDVHHMLTMVIVLGMFALCWMPYVGAAILVTFHETPQTQFIRRCTLVPGLFNSAINWIIYGYRNQDFRNAFKSIVSCKCDIKNSELVRVFTLRSIGGSIRSTSMS